MMATMKKNSSTLSVFNGSINYQNKSLQTFNKFPKLSVNNHLFRGVNQLISQDSLIYLLVLLICFWQDFSMNPSTSLGLRSRDKDKLIGQLSESLNDKISEVVRGQEMNHRLRVEVSEQVKLGETLSMDLNQQLQRKELEM